MKIKDRVTDLISTGLTCSVCQSEIKKEANTGAMGYATNDKNEKICYDCCGDDDERYMIKTGKMMLYLTAITTAAFSIHNESTYKVTNWPNTLSFNCGTVRKGRHNIAGTRYDVWFSGPDGHVWHGVQYGENTQVCHCKRTVERWKKAE